MDNSEEPPTDGAMDEAIASAANDFATALYDFYHEELEKFHLPTVAGAMSAIIGELIITHLHPEEKGSGFVVSDNVKAFIFEGDEDFPPIADVLFNLADPDAELLEEDEIADIILRTAQSFGSDYPALSVPDEYYPTEWSPNAQVTFREYVQALLASYLISGIDRIYVPLIALGMMINEASEYSPELNDKRTLLQLSLEVMYGCSCIAPLKEKV